MLQQRNYFELTHQFYLHESFQHNQLFHYYFGQPIVFLTLQIFEKNLYSYLFQTHIKNHMYHNSVQDLSNKDALLEELSPKFQNQILDFYKKEHHLELKIPKDLYQALLFQNQQFRL